MCSEIKNKDAQFYQFISALVLAIENDKPGIVRLLLSTRPDMETEEYYLYPETLIDIAKEKGNKCFFNIYTKFSCI